MRLAWSGTSKLFCDAIAEEVAQSLARSGALSQDLLFKLMEQRDALAARALQIAGLLFTTLAILTVVMAGQTEGLDLELLGIKIKDRVLFVFLALLCGNLLYVISTGLFIKGIAYEFLLRRLTSGDRFKLGRVAGGFIATHPGNILTYVRESGLADKAGPKAKRLITVTDIYMKYILVVCYGIFFYSVLGIFLAELLKSADASGVHFAYFLILLVLNIMAVVCSFVIFLPMNEEAAVIGDAAAADGESVAG